jgi:hypothetical protein
MRPGSVCQALASLLLAAPPKVAGTLARKRVLLWTHYAGSVRRGPSSLGDGSHRCARGEARGFAAALCVCGGSRPRMPVLVAQARGLGEDRDRELSVV